MNDDQSRREQVRRAVELGKLPPHPPSRCWGGYGNGEACLICKTAVGPSELGFEVELEAQDGSAAVRHHLHVACLTAWELDAGRAIRAPNAPKGASGQSLALYAPARSSGPREPLL